MKKILLFIVIVGFSFTTIAQEKMTEGIMLTKQTITSDNEQISEMMSSMGDIMGTTYFKNSKARSEVSNPMSGDVTVITDGDAQQMLMIMDNPMGKMYSSQSIKPTEEMLNSIKIEEGTETKTILDYECKKYTVSMMAEGQEIKMLMYVTDKISGIKTQQTAMLGDKIKGFPMYVVMDMNQSGMAMKITTEVTELKKEAVSDDKFDMTPPEGYTKM